MGVASRRLAANELLLRIATRCCCTCLVFCFIVLAPPTHFTCRRPRSPVVGSRLFTLLLSSRSVWSSQRTEPIITTTTTTNTALHFCAADVSPSSFAPLCVPVATQRVSCVYARERVLAVGFVFGIRFALFCVALFLFAFFLITYTCKEVAIVPPLTDAGRWTWTVPSHEDRFNVQRDRL